MEWRLSQDVPGPLPNRLHSFWPIWNGGERTTILCVHTNHFEWRSCSPESEGATWRRNAIGNGLQPWLPAELPDDGRRARCSRAPCQRFLLERQQSQIWVQYHVAERLLKVQAEAL
jgi:hypothetical protein